MERVVLITQSDYDEIMPWEDDGGANVEVIYEIIPDLPDSSDKMPTSNEPDLEPQLMKT